MYLIQVIREHYTPLNEVILEDLTLPGLAELKGRWHGSLDASGGGNGDTMVNMLLFGIHNMQLSIALVCCILSGIQLENENIMLYLDGNSWIFILNSIS